MVLFSLKVISLLCPMTVWVVAVVFCMQRRNAYLHKFSLWRTFQEFSKSVLLLKEWSVKVPRGDRFVNILEQTTNLSRSRKFRAGFPYKLVSTRIRMFTTVGSIKWFWLTHIVWRFWNWQAWNQEWKRENIYSIWTGKYNNSDLSLRQLLSLCCSPQKCWRDFFFFSFLLGFTQ